MCYIMNILIYVLKFLNEILICCDEYLVYNFVNTHICKKCNINFEIDEKMSSEEYQIVIQKAFQDKITDILLKNSNLTRIQFETLIIDMLTDIISDNKLSFNEKTFFRSKNVSRGSFSRSLSQARKNVISSIFTIVLLSYIGVFDARPFDEYYILAEKLKEYTNLIESKGIEINKIELKQFERELLEGIDRMATPTSIKLL